MQIRTYEENNETKYIIETIAEKVTLLLSKSKEESDTIDATKNNNL